MDVNLILKVGTGLTETLSLQNCNDAFDSETLASKLVFDNDHLRIIVSRHEDNGLVVFVVDHNDLIPYDFIPFVPRV